MKRQGKPNRGELVICRISKIYPNSAFAEMTEYDASGMIHVSEVAKRWVQSIKEFLKEGQFIVCRVIGVEGDTISLSVKRVAKDEASRKLNEFKRERKAEKLLELAAKEKKVSLEDAWKEVGFEIIENFGGLSKVFELAVKNPESLQGKLPKKWLDLIVDVAKKTFEEKTYEVKANLKLVCYRPDGIEIIKKVLAAAEKNNLVAKYISAPNYLLIGQSKNYKELRGRVEHTAQEIVSEVEKNSGEASFELVK